MSGRQLTPAGDVTSHVMTLLSAQPDREQFVTSDSVPEHWIPVSQYPSVALP